MFLRVQERGGLERYFASSCDILDLPAMHLIAMLLIAEVPIAMDLIAMVLIAMDLPATF